jgi:hypothetical protein
MTVDEWGDKLTADICERPDFYFARVEVARLDQDLDEYSQELWWIQRSIRDAQKTGQWFKTVNKQTCSYCPYFSICTGGEKVGTVPPQGFEFLTDRHPELGRTVEIVSDGSQREPSYW